MQRDELEELCMDFYCEYPDVNKTIRIMCDAVD